ncbi:MAG TPA: hypothetical protein VKZ18_03580 [Polyangia bacterium]|nr:hypothetical protein [Polyangia bacterium]
MSKKNVSSRSLLALTLGLVAAAGCMNPSTSTETASEPLVVNRSQTSGAALGFYFLPPISWSVPPHFSGVFDPDLSPTVRIDQVDASGATITNVATLTGDAQTVRRQPWREFYIARFNTSGLDPADHYRVRVLVDDKELGAADLAVVKKFSDVKNVDLTRYTPVVVGEILPIIFRIEHSAADQDGDGVPDWKDNCPTIYNPPVPVVVDPKPTKPTPPHCDYHVSACDPQELDCHPHVKLEQPDVCSCPSNAASCKPADACHVAGMCDPSTGSCGMMPLPDGTSCSDGNACNGEETCQAGVCTPGAAPTCAATDPCTVGVCDPVNGCATAAAPDGTSCSLDNASGTCSSGVCGAPMCTSGFSDCDGNAANGCETSVLDDVNNCGSCGHACLPSCQATVFTESWESGTDGWTTHDGSAINLTSDGSACGTYQEETVAASGGRVFSPVVPVSAGATYCLTAWIRGTTDSIPFLGIQDSDAQGNLGTEHWLIGLTGYNTGYPNDVVTPVVPDGNWAWFAKPFTADAGTSDIVVKDENFSAGSADFDLIQVFAGACPAAPATTCGAPVSNCQAASCTQGVCASVKLMP